LHFTACGCPTHPTAYLRHTYENLRPEILSRAQLHPVGLEPLISSARVTAWVWFMGKGSLCFRVVQLLPIQWLDWLVKRRRFGSDSSRFPAAGKDHDAAPRDGPMAPNQDLGPSGREDGMRGDPGLGTREGRLGRASLARGLAGQGRSHAGVPDGQQPPACPIGRNPARSDVTRRDVLCCVVLCCVVMRCDVV
jgi:hypothetical protein